MFGLTENGVGLTDMQYTKEIVPAEYMEAVEAAKAGIIAGDIDVWDVSAQGYPDFYQ